MIDNRYDGRLPEPPYQTALDYDSLVAHNEALEARVKELEAERDNLRDWKDLALRVESSWDSQAVGKLLDIGWGQDIRKNIQPKIEALIAERDKLKADVAGLVKAAKRLAYSFPLVDGKYQIFVINNTLISYLAERIDDIKEALAAFKEAEDE